MGGCSGGGGGGGGSPLLLLLLNLVCFYPISAAFSFGKGSYSFPSLFPWPWKPCWPSQSKSLNLLGCDGLPYSSSFWDLSLNIAVYLKLVFPGVLFRRCGFCNFRGVDVGLSWSFALLSYFSRNLSAEVYFIDSISPLIWMMSSYLEGLCVGGM